MMSPCNCGCIFCCCYFVTYGRKLCEHRRGSQQHSSRYCDIIICLYVGLSVQVTSELGSECNKRWMIAVVNSSIYLFNFLTKVSKLCGNLPYCASYKSITCNFSKSRLAMRSWRTTPSPPPLPSTPAPFKGGLFVTTVRFPWQEKLVCVTGIRNKRDPTPLNLAKILYNISIDLYTRRIL